MKVKELRGLIAGIDDDLDVLIRWNDDECCHVGAVASATVETGCTDTSALMIDANDGETS